MGISGKADAARLATVSLFRGLPEEGLRALEARCRWERFDKGQQIIGQEDETNDVLFLISGRARVIIYAASGKLVAFRDIAPGDFVGELSAIDGRPRSASVEVLEPSLVARMSAPAFLDMLREEAAVAEALLRYLTATVRSLTDRVFEFSTLAVQNRIQAELLRLAQPHAGPDGRAAIEPAPTHAEIAARVSTHREAVTRELSRLARLGVITRRGQALHVPDISRLARMVRDVTGG